MNSTIPSPCISVCQMDPASGYCKGCYRTIDEIVRWGQSSEATKQSVWQQLRMRHAQWKFPEVARNQTFGEVA